MRVTFATTEAPPRRGADTIAVGVFEGEGDRPRRRRRRAAGARRLRRGQARRCASSPSPTPAARRYVLAGLGARDDFDPERARVAAAAVVGRARELGTRALCWELPAPRRRRARRRASSRARCWPPTRTTPTSQQGRRRRAGSRSCRLRAPRRLGAASSAPPIAAEAANAARDLQNAPANEMTPTRAGRARARARRRARPDRRGRWAARRSRRRAWARSPPSPAAAHEEPRLITLRYEPADAPGPVLGFVGKARDVRLRRHLDQARARR